MPLILKHVSSEGHVSVIHNNSHAPTVVLRSSLTNLPRDDMLAAMSVNRTDTTIDVAADPTPFSAPEAHSASLPRFTGESLGHPSVDAAGAAAYYEERGGRISAGVGCVCAAAATALSEAPCLSTGSYRRMVPPRGPFKVSAPRGSERCRH